MGIHGTAFSGLGRWRVLSQANYTVTGTGTATLVAGPCEAVAVWAQLNTDATASNGEVAFLNATATAVSQEGFEITPTRDEPLVIPVNANSNEIRVIGNAGDVLCYARLVLKE